MSSSPFVIRATPVYGPLPGSPSLDPESFALDFTVQRAVSEAGQATVAVLAGAVLPGRYGNIYGGRLAGAVKIVAIDVRAGGVYHREAERGHAVPLPLVMDPNPAPPPSDEAELEAVEVYFAVDLRAHLTLPAAAGVYAVFLWLDEMTSPVRVVQVPGPERVGPVTPPAGRPIDGVFMLRRTEGTPPAGGAEIVLQRGGVAPGGIRIYGAVGPELLAAPPQAGGDYLAVMALDFRSRMLRWRGVPVPRVALAARELAFDFDLLGLFGGPGWLDRPQLPRRAFVLASTRNAVSRVLVVEA
jgi:hypothetical protein